MDNSSIIYTNGKIWLSKEWLVRHEINGRTIDKWIELKLYGFLKSSGNPFFEFELLPQQTKKKLPTFAELKSVATDSKSELLYTRLYQDSKKTFAKYIKEVKAYTETSTELVHKFAQRAAVLEAALEINTAGNGMLMSMTEAFQKLLPGWIKSKNVLGNILNKARKEGVLKASIDARYLDNDNAKKFDDYTKQRAAYYYASPKAYSANQVRACVDLEISKYNLPLPSLRTIKYWCKQFEKNRDLYASRYGSVKAFNKIEPYVTTIPALYANDQWQADGLSLPFYSKGYVRYTVFFVLDAHSRKIIGYSIDESESTLMILRAYNDAVNNVDGLPFEIKMDNHSYNRTLEGLNFKADTEAFGVKWTISHNPRHKSLIERTNKTLNEQYFKLEKGYIGQGVKSQNRGGHTAPELLDKYQKSSYWMTKDEIIAIVVKSIDAYNDTPLKRTGKSPNQHFKESEALHTIPVSFDTKIKLFIKRTQKKVVRGQINIERSGIKYEYQLPAKLFAKCNGELVGIRYEDLDSIYIFDKKDNYLGCINQKPKIYGALANQTDNDIELLNQSKGRLTGISKQSRKENEALTEKAISVNPEAFGFLNPLTTPKDILKEVEQNHLKARCEEMGIDFSKAEKGLPVDEFPLKSLKPSEPKSKSPFAQKNHVPKLLIQSFNSIDND
jgi:hypothetical protein